MRLAVCRFGKKGGKAACISERGKSKAGAKAALSHAAGLAGNSRLLSDVSESSGVCLATDFHQVLDLARILTINSVITPACRLAIVSFSGVAGIVSCDLMAKLFIKLRRLGAEDHIIGHININAVAVTAGRPVAVDANIVL